MKRCSDCGERKELSEFRPKPANKDGREGRCKVCRNIRYNKADPNRVFKKVYQSQVLHSVDRGHVPPDYSLEEFKQWVDAQPNASTLWEAYVASGYDTNLRPSADRKDDSLPYTLSNLQLITWKENRQRGADAKKACTLNANQRPVRGRKVAGGAWETFPSIMAAVRAVGGRMHGIASVANGKPVKDGRGKLYQPKTYKGYVWEWA